MKKIIEHKDIKPFQKQLLVSNKWEESDSKWNIYGKTNTVFAFRFISLFGYSAINNYNSILRYILDTKIDNPVTNGKIALIITERQLADIGIFGTTRRQTIRKYINELIDIGLLQVSTKSNTKGVASKYYLVCPAALLLGSINEPKKENLIIKEEQNDWE